MLTGGQYLCRPHFSSSATIEAFCSTIHILFHSLSHPPTHPLAHSFAAHVQPARRTSGHTVVPLWCEAASAPSFRHSPAPHACVPEDAEVEARGHLGRLYNRVLRHPLAGIAAVQRLLARPLISSATIVLAQKAPYWSPGRFLKMRTA